MLDREIKKRLIDYFEPGELVDYLGITIEDIVEIFEDDIEELIEDVEEFIGYRATRDDDPDDGNEGDDE